MAKIDIRSVLDKRGISVRQFAKVMDVRYDNAFKMLRKGYNPRFSSLVKIASRLKCRVTDLIADDKKR